MEFVDHPHHLVLKLLKVKASSSIRISLRSRIVLCHPLPKVADLFFYVLNSIAEGGLFDEEVLIKRWTLRRLLLVTRKLVG